MRALLITTFSDLDDPRLRQLVDILRRSDVEPVTSGSLGAGSYLRDRLSRDIGIGIVILPRKFAEHRGSLALMVEAGICLGADIPLLVVVDPDDKVPVALATVQHVKAAAADIDALALHVGMFIQNAQSLRLSGRPSSVQPAEPSTTIEASATDVGRRTQLGYDFVDQIASLLRTAGKEPVLGRLDYGADIAFAVGDDTPLVVVAQAKMIGPHSRIGHAARRLAEYVDQTGAGMGLMVTDEPALDAASGDHASILVLSIEELRQVIAGGDLDSRIQKVRNRIVHGS